MNSHRPFGHPSQRLVFGMEVFDCRTPLVVPPLVEPMGHRPLQVVHPGSHCGVFGDLPPLSQPVLQAYLILNGSRYRRLWVVTRATGKSRGRQILQNCAGVLNGRVYCHLVVQFRIKLNFNFQVCLEVDPLSAPESRAIRWVLRR